MEGELSFLLTCYFFWLGRGNVLADMGGGARAFAWFG